MIYSAESIRPLHEWAVMDYKQRQKEYKEREIKENAQLIHQQRKINEQNNAIYNYITNIHTKANNRSKFLEDTKIALTSAALYKVCRNAFNEQLTSMDESVLNNLFTTFVKEQGPFNLLNEWKYQNTTIAELGRVIIESYESIRDSLPTVRAISMVNEDEQSSESNNKPIDILKLDKDQIDNFYNNLIDVDTNTASNEIHDRVKTAINDFIDQNNKTKANCEEIIDNAKAKMDSLDNIDNINSVQVEATRQVNQLRTFRFKNPFHYLVESIVKEYMHDEKLNNISETKKIMENAMHSAKLIYTFLETLNTLEAVDESFIQDYIRSTLKN